MAKWQCNSPFSACIPIPSQSICEPNRRLVLPHQLVLSASHWCKHSERGQYYSEAGRGVWTTRSRTSSLPLICPYPTPEVPLPSSGRSLLGPRCCEFMGLAKLGSQRAMLVAWTFAVLWVKCFLSSRAQERIRSCGSSPLQSGRLCSRTLHVYFVILLLVFSINST